MPSVLKEEFYFQAAGHRLHGEWLRPSSPPLKKPTLVFLHEALGSIPQWKSFPAELVRKTGCPALVYERYGFGKSDPLAELRTANYLHDEGLIALPEVLKTCGLDDVILIGHSDGGSIALLFASAVPLEIRLRGVITEAAHVMIDEQTLAGIRETVANQEKTELVRKLKKYHEDRIASLFFSWHGTWLLPEFREWSIEDRLPHITTPLLVIQGRDDEFGTLAQVDSIVSKSAGPATALILENCAHIPHLQARERVLSAMGEFIESLL